MKLKSPNSRISFYISLTYIILATIYAYGHAYNSWNEGILYYILSPAILLPTLIFLTEDSVFLILVIQFFTFLFIWFFSWLIVSIIRNNLPLNKISEK